jgi:hypothetical protein
MQHIAMRDRNPFTRQMSLGSRRFRPFFLDDAATTAMLHLLRVDQNYTVNCACLRRISALSENDAMHGQILQAWRSVCLRMVYQLIGQCDSRR